MVDVIGAHCSHELCRQLDFLPFTCKNCSRVFCLEHHKFKDHDCNTDITLKGKMPQCPLCSKFVKVKATDSVDAIVNAHILSGCVSHLLEKSSEEKKKTASKKHCGLKGCSNPNKFDTLICAKCRKQFCLSHRHEESHNCPGAGQPGKKTNSAASRLLASIKGKPKKAKKPLNPKILLMKVKMRAVGDSGVKESDRFFLEVEFPEVSLTGVAMKKKPLSMWFNVNWTIGKVVDSICKKSGLENRNNDAKAKKLNVYSKRTQAQFPHDIALSLLQPELCNGDTVQLRYV